MATRLTDASQQAAANGVVDQLDAAAGNLKIYSGAQAADADSADPSGLLVTIALAAPAFGAANSSGTAALLGTPRTGTAAAAGTAASFVVENNAGTNVFTGTVTATGGGGDLTLDNVSIASGQQVSISSFTYTQPAS